MKEVISKTNKSGSCLPTKFVINENDVTSETGIANKFKKFFKKIGPELVRKISVASRTFESFLKKIDIIMSADSVNLKKPFFSLETNRSPGYDE